MRAEAGVAQQLDDATADHDGVGFALRDLGDHAAAEGEVQAAVAHGAVQVLCVIEAAAADAGLEPARRTPLLAHVVVPVGQRVAGAVQGDDLFAAQLREHGLEPVVLGLRGPLRLGGALGGAGARGFGLDPGAVLGRELIRIEVLVGDHPADVGIGMEAAPHQVVDASARVFGVESEGHA
ncbi:hypothetical protein D9M68_675890 [compost metagenome]